MTIHHYLRRIVEVVLDNRRRISILEGTEMATQDELNELDADIATEGADIATLTAAVVSAQNTAAASVASATANAALIAELQAEIATTGPPVDLASRLSQLEGHNSDLLAQANAVAALTPAVTPATPAAAVPTSDASATTATDAPTGTGSPVEAQPTS